MLIHFEDWSHPIVVGMLPPDLPNEKRIIKAFAGDDDPCKALQKPELVVVEASGEPFDRDDVFEYGQRGAFAGLDLEDMLEDYTLNELGKCTVRALFRFSNQYGFCQEAMAATRDGDWLITDPLDEIHGYNTARESGHENELHLDIYFPNSLRILKNVVDYDNPASVLTVSESMSRKRNNSRKRPI